MFIFTILLALACVACDAEDGPTGLKGAVGNEDAGLTNLDVTWTEVGTTEAQGLLTLGDPVATVVAVNLGRKGDQFGNYSILQLRINPVEVPPEALERNDYLLPLDPLLQPLDGETVTVNDLAVGTLEIIETYGPPLDGVGDDFHFFYMEVLQARVETEDADAIFASIGGKSWAEIQEGQDQ